MKPPEQSVRLRITGRVQGVGYRLWATRTAAGLGLRGWVRNRFDGTVEAMVTGAPERVSAMVEACWRGPRAAQVSEVSAVSDTDDGSIGFSALPSE
jgi:acylphosphatase